MAGVTISAAVLAWSLFGGGGDAAKSPAAPAAAEVDAAVEKAVKATTEKAVREAAESAAKAAAETVAKAAADEKAAAEQAEKLRVEAKADAERLRVEAREDAAKARAEAREDAEKAKTELDAARRQIDTRIFRLSHASAIEVAEAFNNMWSGDFGVNWKVTKMAVPFPESNSIMVTAPRMILEACEKSISEIDVEAKQVYIEARFVELGNTASHKVGIDWAMLDGMTGSATLGGGIQSYTVGKAVGEYSRSITTKGDGTTTFKVAGSDAEGSDGSITYFNGTLNFSQMALTLRMLDSTEDAKTFSNPKIIVSSGKKAVVDMTTKYPNVKIAAKRTEGVNATTSLDIAANLDAIPGEDKFMFAKEAFFSWGVSLEVTPRIGTNGLINVSIVPTISSREDWVETGTSADSEGTVSSKYPVIKVQRLVSEFNLASGTTAVIGGLSVTEEVQRDSGIPLLREIPIVGTRLFGSIERVKVQKEIIVFVTVGLVDPRSIHENAGLPKNAVLGRQYVKGQKLEPGDRQEKNMEGIDSIDMRPLDEQARDPLRRQKDGFGFRMPFSKDPNYTKEER